MEILRGVHADDFTQDADVYLFSHFHRDHMDGFCNGWAKGPLIASEQTCLLAEKIEKVDRSVLRPVRIGETVKENGVEVTALPANHCPGAVMFHVRRGKESALYTGDFRLDDEVRAALDGLDPVDVLFIDSTYSDPQYSFPPKEEALAQVVELVQKAPEDAEVMLAVYTVGKNCIVEAVSRALGKPVYLTAKALRVYKLLGMGEYVTGDKDSTHLRGYSRGFFDEYFFMQPRKRRERAYVVIPTGWAADQPEGTFKRGGATFTYVPYSEHCDHAELEEALRIIPARRVVEI